MPTVQAQGETHGHKDFDRGAGDQRVSAFSAGQRANAARQAIITDPVYTRPDQIVDIGGGRRLNMHRCGKRPWSWIVAIGEGVMTTAPRTMDASGAKR